MSDDKEDNLKNMINITNSLNFTQTQVNFILAHSLAAMYQEVLSAPVPEHLQALLNQLDAQQASDEDHRS